MDLKRGCWVICWVVLAARSVAAGISCLSNPCLHGICIDDVNSTYSCYCIDGFTGVTCQTNWDECWSQPCQNGGFCVDGVASYNCTCPEGFVGDNCEINYDECESNPCYNNGTCIDMTNGYVCSCVPGFSGEHCEVDIAVCNATEEVRCYNGGQCIEGSGFKFYCKCLPGWTGHKCEEPIDECESNPCRNGGVCIDVHADYLCACTFGFTGKSCEVQIEFCDENSCSNNALCVVEGGERVCYCVPDYHGDRCEQQYNECLLGPGCMNGGTCIDGVDNFTCSCPPRLTGSLCECLILDNESLNCNYIRPTFPPETTRSVILTTIYDELTTEIVTAGSSVVLNNTTTEQEYTTFIARTDGTTDEIMPITDKPSTEIIVLSSFTPTSLSANESSETTTFKSDIYTFETKPPDSVILETTTEISNFEGTVADHITTSYFHPDAEISTEESVTNHIVTEEATAKEIPTEYSPTFTTKTYDVTDEVTEIPTTPKIDETTEKMFTETPTEYSVTDILTPKIPITIATTESGEITTAFDNTSYVYTTVQSECSESFCNRHGTCINTALGIQCQCNFNYQGRFCEERRTVNSAAFSGNSYVAHKILNSTTIYVEFDAKTLLNEGQLMYVDIAKGVYMQLYLKTGLLKFKFSCGYQTMLLSELKTFVNQGYSMKIETRLDIDLTNQHCNATLRLNDTVAMSGGQVANISSLNDYLTLILGNSPTLKDVENKPFIGCITNLTVNGDKRAIFGEAIEAGDITECTSLQCLSAPCLNGGSCKDFQNGYTCACSNGWTGDHCDRSVCDHNPCQSGGSCVRHPGSGFLCLCPYGKHGIFCDYNVEITRPSLAPIGVGVSSYFIYPMSQSAINSERFDLRLRFQTTDMDQIALLVFIGQNGRHDYRSPHIAVTFVKGYIMLTWNLGSGPRRIFTPRPLSERRGGHTIRVGRRGRSAWLSVDSRFNVTGNAPGSEQKMTTLPYVFIGGHPSKGFQALPHDLPLHNGWQGCIWEVGGSGVGSGKALAGRGVGQCGVTQCTAKSCNAPRGVCIHSPATYGCICNEGWFGPTCSSSQNPCDRANSKCQGQCVVTTGEAHCDCPYGKTGLYCEKELYPTDVLFTGVRSYVRLTPRQISSVSLSLEAEVRPTKARGLLLFAETPHFYTALSMQGGLLEYRWTDRVSGVTSLVRSNVVLSMSEWHHMKAGRYGSRLYVWVDGAISTDNMLAHAYPHTASNASVILGGAEDLSSLPFDVMSGPLESYTGCIRNLQVNNILIPLEKQNIEGGQNVGDCDGTPCGGEACGGGSCIVEDGTARCSCGAGAETGARCRRQVPCRRASCTNGVCRRGRCVCSNGYAGDACDQKINVTIPQFDGDSLLSLVRRPAGARAGEQRVGSSAVPGSLALNFTTAAENGLLLWLDMGMDYLGIGLEKGDLKLVWSFTKENSIELHEKIRIMDRVLPQAGFLADAEWHHLVLIMDEGNVTVTVDQRTVLNEDPGFSFENNVVDLFFGGVADTDSAAKKHFPHNLKGCIDNMSTSETGAIGDYADVYTENVKSCQLYP